jgi:hypothetical protein
MTLQTPSPEGRPARTTRGLTLLLTWATKLIGLAAAFEQFFLHGGNPKPVPLFVAAFMMAGAQFSEGLILQFLDRLFGEPGKQVGETGEKP